MCQLAKQPFEYEKVLVKIGKLLLFKVSFKYFRVEADIANKRLTIHKIFVTCLYSNITIFHERLML